jgi:MFS family permease
MEKQQNDASHLRNFFQDNMKAIRYIINSMPLVVCVVIIDAISDSLFKFGALIYANEVLGVSIIGINTILLFTLILSSLLVLKTGRASDKGGVRKTAIGIYSIMPISAILLISASIFPYWAQTSIVDTLNGIVMGSGVIFSVAFLGIVLKYVNDALWWLIILVIVKKHLPRKDSSKVLAIFMMLVYIFMSAGPFIGSLLFTFFDPSYLFWIVLVLNVTILCVLLKGDFLNDDEMNNKEKTGTQELV